MRLFSLMISIIFCGSIAMAEQTEGSKELETSLDDVNIEALIPAEQLQEELENSEIEDLDFNDLTELDEESEFNSDDKGRRGRRGPRYRGPRRGRHIPPRRGRYRPAPRYPRYRPVPRYPRYPRGRVSREVVCYAENARGNTYRAVGYNSNIVQSRAMNRCYDYSLVCYRLGCQRY